MERENQLKKMREKTTHESCPLTDSQHIMVRVQRSFFFLDLYPEVPVDPTQTQPLAQVALEMREMIKKATTKLRFHTRKYSGEELIR